MGRKRQVERVAGGIGHQAVADVSLDDLDDGLLDGQERQVADEGQPIRAAIRRALANSSRTTSLVTNSSRPAASSHHLRVQSRRATMSGAGRSSKKRLGIVVST